MNRMKFYNKITGEEVILHISESKQNAIFTSAKENRVMTRNEAGFYATQAGLTRKKPSVAPIVKETLTEILNKRKLV